ncbi:DUF4232 domain-containing protein [Cryobacterium sp. SO2]|uniref:DUF4232 domain-containing protein n=1 Tax=Cryobacterium sp. SO2 TaxID=1897060 RepID=UPI00223D1ECE|nr:DUF4232 domain-containing protein [Cryobacterium sp. SO2]WEO76250.1 DUF4232 domain-containing protein [Cryobacterium sp. SO2]
MSSWGRVRLGWGPSLAAAVLWLGSSGVFAYLAWQERIPRQVLAHVVPEGMPSSLMYLTFPWIVLVPLLSTATVFVVHLLLAGLVGTDASGPRSTRFLALWFVAVLTGVLAILPFAVSAIITEFPPSRAAFILDPAGSLILHSGYWGLICGWIPALLASRSRARVAVPAAEATPAASRRPALLLAGVVVLALGLSGLSVGAGARAARVASAEASAVAEGQTLGDAPDPDVESTPPPTVAPGADLDDIDPTWCTPEQATPLLGDPDAATGHRVLSIEVMNFSDTPCVLDGYPDLAFADADGSAIDVTITHGGSFMAEDPGAMPITVPAHGYGVTRIGWNAMATDGELATYTLYSALYPGLERGSWPITLDIVAGGEVFVTAWSVSEPAPAGE